MAMAAGTGCSTTYVAADSPGGSLRPPRSRPRPSAVTAATTVSTVTPTVGPTVASTASSGPGNRVGANLVIQRPAVAAARLPETSRQGGALRAPPRRTMGVILTTWCGGSQTATVTACSALGPCNWRPRPGRAGSCPHWQPRCESLQAPQSRLHLFQQLRGSGHCRRRRWRHCECLCSLLNAWKFSSEAPERILQEALQLATAAVSLHIGGLARVFPLRLPGSVVEVVGVATFLVQKSLPTERQFIATRTPHLRAPKGASQRRSLGLSVRSQRCWQR
mmetsp:Transcript_41081/g.89765  ORF Transcript_41081/g.89765 Transcript_41081/m.89765 type:complete len:277 (+) Transcript_41081:399-1229(+)